MAPSAAEVYASHASTWRPPARLSLSEWADANFYLSPESAAEPGRWHTLPYQRGVMDAITDPTVERVTLMKSARVGFTKLVNAAIGYYMHQDPCPILVVQPTVEDAQGYSKEEIAPMLRDCAVLAGIIREPTAKVSDQTILAKTFPGGSLTMVGANSGRGFRRVSRRVVIFDEVDGYPPSAGTEGDQIKLGERRTEYYWNRKIIAGSTPLVAGASRIEEMFEAGDQRRYHVPCPQCGHRDVLVFREGGRGHYMRWPEGKPEEAFFVCSANGCSIEDHQKRAMLEAGEWVAGAPFRGHASFAIWQAYSLSPNATWGQIATEFVDAKGKPEKLRTFVNTSLGETWQERGEAPDWERLYQRREPYPIGSVPAGVKIITAGVDVQKDRFVFEVVGWSETKESWSIDAGVLLGDTALDATWAQLDQLVARTYRAADGSELPIHMTAIDSGYATQTVYGWARGHSMSRVIACKGVQQARALIGIPSAVDVTVRGRRISRGYKVWIVGVSLAKSELYGWLRLQIGTDGVAPPGYCHFPEYSDEYFRQITAEQLVSIRKRSGYMTHEWQLIANRENHWLDARILARAAASVLGLDRQAPRGPAKPPSLSPEPPVPRPPGSAAPIPQRPPVPPQRPEPPRPPGRAPGWLGGGRPGWLGRRR
jgi:phage terminase large subunit GpA-like protein